MSELRLLELTARARLTPDFMKGDVGVDVRDLVRPFDDRKVDIDPVKTVLELAMAQPEFEGNAPASDAWVAPRVHAALRLTRREAADRRLWAWLAVVQFPEYVRWRFPGDEKGTPIKRFFGRARDHALARLWWGAELTRNGPDYTTTIAAFRNQDFPNTWFSLRAFEHRAAAIAACRVVAPLTSRQINDLATAFDHIITTIMLDSVAISSPTNADAVKEWIAEEFDDSDLDRLPTGPREDPVPENEIAAVEALLLRIATELRIVGPAPAGEQVKLEVEEGVPA
jgi:hypothetical protein